MKIKILCPEKVATHSHRTQEEYVDVSPSDNMSTVKVKCSMIYESIDIDEFELTYNHQVLKEELLVSDLLKQNTTGAEITLILRVKDSCCRICWFIYNL